MDLIDLILDIGLEVLVEDGVTKRVILSLEHFGEHVVEIESKGHAEDALRGIHQVRIPMQGLKSFVAVPWTVERQHAIAWRHRFWRRCWFHLQILLYERRARDVERRQPIPVVQK